MKLEISNLTPEDVQKFMVLWGRLKGPEVNSEDFKYTPDPWDYVLAIVSNPTQEATQNA